jgi:hypothetical protein
LTRGPVREWTGLSLYDIDQNVPFAPSTSIRSITVGYADGVTLRTVLRRRLHQGIKEMRRTP